MIAVGILIFAIFLLCATSIVLYFLKDKAEKTISSAQQEAATATQRRISEVSQARLDAESAVAKARHDAESAIAQARGEAQNVIDQTRRDAEATANRIQAAYDQKATALDTEAERIRKHYQAEARELIDKANQQVAELEPLNAYAGLQDVERTLKDALAEASLLRQQANALLEQTRHDTAEERLQAQRRAREIRAQSESVLTQATRDAGRIVANAEQKAQQIAGDAYEALRDKQTLEQAVQALWNVTEGYGDRYVIPTHSLLDDLALDFGYDEAGQALHAAREQSRRMVEQKQAATCNYEELDRRERANRFIIDAFNGRVDAILSRVRHDNFGQLEQEIRDAYSLVNLNGIAFRDAHILPAYLEARLSELRWAVAVNELARKQREEQRYLKERLRDEEKARREYEEKMREAAREEELKRKAVEEAEKKFASAAAEQKAQLEQELEKLRGDLADATQKTLTIAQQTKKGHVYIVSNIGAFGEGVYKVGQTRRPDPQERIDELGAASVPFEFDVHALIESENAPVLEHRIHKQLLAMQVNKINSRKEFFRVKLADIRAEVDKLKRGEDFLVKVWTEAATAAEYRESLDIENNPEKKKKWLERQEALSDRQLELDAIRLVGGPHSDSEEENLDA